MDVIKETKEKFYEIYNVLEKYHKENGGEWNHWRLFGEREYESKEIAKGLYDLMKGKDFYVDLKEKYYTRFVRCSYSYSMKARYLIIVEMTHNPRTDRVHILLHQGVFFKRWNAKVRTFNGSKPKGLTKNL